jgi:hypothetical protein
VKRCRDLSDHALAYLASQLELRIAALRPAVATETGKQLAEQYTEQLNKLTAEIHRRRAKGVVASRPSRAHARAFTGAAPAPKGGTA